MSHLDGVKQVGKGMKRVCLSGYTISHHVYPARQLLTKIGEEKEQGYETYFKWHKRWSKDETHIPYVQNIKDTLLNAEDKERFCSREGWSAPFCWLETADDNDNVIVSAIGGRDDLKVWAAKEFPQNKAIQDMCKNGEPWSIFFINPSVPGTAGK